ncbi:MAG: DUF5658 family protein [Desulfurococcaceae archaeon]
MFLELLRKRLLVVALALQLTDYVMTELFVFRLGLFIEANSAYIAMRQIHALLPLIAKLTAVVVVYLLCKFVKQRSKLGALLVVIAFLSISLLPVLWNLYLLTS